MSEVDNNAVTSQAAEAAQTVSQPSVQDVAKGLDKFKGSDGDIDVAKLAQSYQELERKLTEEAQRRAESEKAYALLAGVIGTPSAPENEGRVAPSYPQQQPEPVEDEPLTARDAKPVVQALIGLAHPELSVDPATGKVKDEEFFNGLVGYMRTLPMYNQIAIAKGDFYTMDWAIRQYKAIKAKSAVKGGASYNYIEGASAGDNTKSTGGTVYSRRELTRLMAENPKEYARIADDIAKAYAEGRIKE